MVTYHVIGKPTRRVDGEEKATGQARYAADVSLPGTLWGKSLRDLPLTGEKGYRALKASAHS